MLKGRHVRLIFPFNLALPDVRVREGLAWHFFSSQPRNSAPQSRVRRLPVAHHMLHMIETMVGYGKEPPVRHKSSVECVLRVGGWRTVAAGTPSWLCSHACRFGLMGCD